MPLYNGASRKRKQSLTAVHHILASNCGNQARSIRGQPGDNLRCASLPLSAGVTSGGFLSATWMARVVAPPAHADRVVVTAQRAASFMYTNARVETGLKPYQPIGSHGS